MHHEARDWGAARPVRWSAIVFSSCWIKADNLKSYLTNDNPGGTQEAEWALPRIATRTRPIPLSKAT
jgi:hypothetical protein